MTTQRAGLAACMLYESVPALNGVTETQIVTTGMFGVTGKNDTRLFYDGPNSTVYGMPWDQHAGGSQATGMRLVPTVCRFPTVRANNRGQYDLCGVDHADGVGDLRWWQTGDPSLTNWPQNAGHKALDRVAANMPHIYNVSPCFIGNDVATLIERDGGLIFARVPYNHGAPNLNAGIAMTNGAPVLAIPGGGNADLRLSANGKFYIAWIGMRDSRLGSDWYTTVATCSVSADARYPEAWTVHRDTFFIGQAGGFICDPCVFDWPDGTGTMLVSYNIVGSPPIIHIRKLTLPMPFAQIEAMLTA